MSSNTPVSRDDRVSPIEALFDGAADLDPAAQAEFLREHCAHDPELEREVRELLSADQAADGVLHRPKPIEAPFPLSDTTMGNYHDLQQLDEGGMGVVYTATHVALDKKVAIKVLHATLADQPDIVKRFRNEASTLAKLSHPGIVDVYDVGVHDSGSVYIAMEFLDGESLEHRLARETRLPLGTALSFAQQTAHTLMAVHESHIIHRDLKPDNLFVVSDPEVPGGERIKILDFGIAKLTQGGSVNTKSGTVLGTPAYMSPEQCRDSVHVDHRTDLYALGVILFRMLCGRLPFIIPKGSGFSIPQLERPAPRVDLFYPDIPPRCVDIVARLLAISPDERFASAQQFADALHSAAPAIKRRGDTRLDLEPGGQGTAQHTGPPAQPSPEHTAPLKTPPPRHVSHSHEARAHLWSYAWLDSELRASGPRALLEPFSRVESHGDQALLRDAIALSASTLARDPAQLPTQLIGRLAYFEHQEPRIAALLTQARQVSAHAWLCPTAPSLTPPGASLIRTFTGHTHAIDALAISADGSRGISGSRDGSCALWDIDTGQRICTFDGHTDRVSTASLSADGTRAMTGSRHGEITLWNTHTRMLMRTFEQSLGDIGALALSADGARALIGASTGVMYLWDTRSGQLIHTFQAHAMPVNALALSPDGTRALSGSSDRSCKLWDTRSGRLEHVLDGHAHPVEAVALGARGARALSGSRDGTLILWNTRNGELIRTFDGHDDAIDSVTLSADSALAVSSSGDGAIKRWDTRSGARLHAFEHPAGSAQAVALTTDGIRVLSGSSNGTIELWSTRDAALARAQPGHTDWVRALALSADGTRAISGSNDHTVKLWNPRNGELIHSFPHHSDRVRAVALDVHGTRALSGSNDGTMMLWNARTGARLHTFRGHMRAVRAVALSADGTRALSGSDDRRAVLWDTRTGQMIHAFGDHAASVTAVALSSDGHQALTGDDSGVIKRWNTHGGQLIQICRDHTDIAPIAPVHTLGFAVADPLIFAGLRDGRVLYWTLDTGAIERSCRASTDDIRCMQISADGTRALIGHPDSSLAVVDLTDQRVLCTFIIDAPIPTCALADDDPTLIAVGDQSGRIHFLRSTAGRPASGDPLQACAPRTASTTAPGKRPGVRSPAGD